MNPGGLPPVLLRQDPLKLVVDVGEVAHRAAAGEPGERFGGPSRPVPGPGDGQGRGAGPRQEQQDNAEQADRCDYRPHVRDYVYGRHGIRIGLSPAAENRAATGAGRAFAVIRGIR